MVSLSFITIPDVSFTSGLVDSATGLVRIMRRESSHHNPITVCVIFVFTEASNITCVWKYSTLKVVRESRTPTWGLKTQPLAPHIKKVTEQPVLNSTNHPKYKHLHPQRANVTLASGVKAEDLFLFFWCIWLTTRFFFFGIKHVSCRLSAVLSH